MILPKKLLPGFLAAQPAGVVRSFCHQAEVDSTDDLILLQRRMQFTAVST